jgi:hypothetical protein
VAHARRIRRQLGWVGIPVLDEDVVLAVRYGELYDAALGAGWVSSVVANAAAVVAGAFRVSLVHAHVASPVLSLVLEPQSQPPDPLADGESP